jgi:cob(I)alamin adenosyltransferase
MLKRGLIQVYTSRTEHFNFAPLGLSLRASGHHARTLITCFAEHARMDGLDTASLLLRPHLVIDPSPAEGQGNGLQPMAAFRKAEAAVLEGGYDLVIFDSINPLLHAGSIPAQEVLSLADRKPSGVELVLSGARAPEAILDRADLVTDMVVTSPGERRPAETQREPAGAIEVITGDGKGKTTYCLGKAMLRSCAGVRSAILQFMKSPQPYGEIRAIARLPQLDVKTMGEGFVFPDRPEEKPRHLKAARMAWEECLREVFSLRYGLVVLDEINNATYHGLVNPARVREMLFLKPHHLHLLLSGRNAHLEVRAAAATVIEMREIKHPYKKGIGARKGIEF